jgi:hypothetical protein
MLSLSAVDVILMLSLSRVDVILMFLHVAW